MVNKLLSNWSPFVFSASVSFVRSIAYSAGSVSSQRKLDRNTERTVSNSLRTIWASILLDFGRFGVFQPGNFLIATQICVQVQTNLAPSRRGRLTPMPKLRGRTLFFGNRNSRLFSDYKLMLKFLQFGPSDWFVLDLPISGNFEFRFSWFQENILQNDGISSISKQRSFFSFFGSTRNTCYSAMQISGFLQPGGRCFKATPAWCTVSLVISTSTNVNFEKQFSFSNSRLTSSLALMFGEVVVLLRTFIP